MRGWIVHAFINFFICFRLSFPSADDFCVIASLLFTACYKMYWHDPSRDCNMGPCNIFQMLGWNVRCVCELAFTFGRVLFNQRLLENDKKHIRADALGAYLIKVVAQKKIFICWKWEDISRLLINTLGWISPDWYTLFTICSVCLTSIPF